MFGYYCVKPGEALSADRIEDLISDIRIRGVTERRRLVVAGAAATTPRDPGEAAAVAKGVSANADTGNSKFPFAFAVRYPDADGFNRRP
jgi:hypothetical protein